MSASDSDFDWVVVDDFPQAMRLQNDQMRPRTHAEREIESLEVDFGPLESLVLPDLSLACFDVQYSQSFTENAQNASNVSLAGKLWK